MKKHHFFLHPVFIFIMSLLAWGLSFFLYLHWYLKVNENAELFVQKFKVDKTILLDPHSWIIVLTMSLLLALIMLGMATIFVYYQKIQQLYRLQENFINNFTHELKTPLTSIRLYLEAFKKYELTKIEQQTFIQHMLKDTDRLTENVSHILQLASLEHKKIDDQISNIQLDDFITEYLKQHSDRFPTELVTFTNHLSHVPFTWIRPQLFQMVLNNILQNAIKYSDAPPRIQIELEKNHSLSSNHLLISIKDEGIGMEKKHLKLIFRKFYQIGRSHNRTAKGNGIGLYLSQQIIKVHKGKIWATSPGLGKGSCFYVLLPCTNESSSSSSKKNEHTVN